MKIVITNDQGLTKDQFARINSLGEVKFFKSLPKDKNEYLSRIKEADIIFSGGAGFSEAQNEIKNKFITVSFVSVAFLDLDMLAKNGVKVANAPGSNKHAVTEWIIWMLISLARKFDVFVNTDEDFRKNGELPPINNGIADRKITILGKGNIGSHLGGILERMGANVRYFKRGDDLYESVGEADYVIDTLSSNQTTKKLLDAKFFESMKSGGNFISVTRSEIVDDEALIAALDDGHLSGAAMDCGGILVGDTNDKLYIKFAKHPKIIATPHIAYNSEKSGILGNDIAIDNIEAWLKGTPQNILN